MLSLRQYRNIGDRIKVQIECAREKAASSQTSRSQSAVLSTVDTVGPAADISDPEKARPSTFEDKSRNIPAGEPNTPVSIESSRTSVIFDNLPGIHAEDQVSQSSNATPSYVVDYDHQDDPLNPQNWSTTAKAWATLLIYLHGSIVGIASSIDAAALVQSQRDFNVSRTIEDLTTGLFLIGFGFGALVSGPFSERYGRIPALIFSWLLYTICVMGSGLSPNIGHQLAFRFCAGFLGSTPLTLGGASIGDMWSATERLYAFPVFGNAAIMGPVLGPVLGNFISANDSISWRWTEWTDMSIAGAVLLLVLLTQRESHTPTLLGWKAKHLRQITGSSCFHTRAELTRLPIPSRLRRIFTRPFTLTACSPALILLTLWLSLVWILEYTFIYGYRIIFGQTYGLSGVEIGLCFLGIALGLCISSACVPIFYYLARHDLRLNDDGEQGPPTLPPSTRLRLGLVSAPCVPVALFTMAFTATPHVSMYIPLAASVLLGFGMLGIFISSCEFIVATCGAEAPFALGFNTFTRYLIAGMIVEASPTAWLKVGARGGLLMLGAATTILTPVPWVLWFLRRRRGT